MDEQSAMTSPESEFELTQAVWTNAVINTEQVDPFSSSPAWQLAFHEAFNPARRLLIERTSDSVICFAENFFSPSEIFLTPIEPHWFFGCPLLGNDAVDLFAMIMPFLAVEYAPHFPRILISGIPMRSTLPERLVQSFADSFTIRLHSVGLQCAASLEDDMDGFLSRRSAGFRKNLRQVVRRATDRGVYFERVIPRTLEEAQTAYSRLIAVEHASWKGLNSCGMTESPIKEFYAAMTRRMLRHGDARIIMARYDEEDIGYIFGGLIGNIYRGLQFSYDDKWRNYSIGNLMQHEKIRWLVEEGIVRYDMGSVLGESMSYKANWTEERIPYQCWILEKR